MNASIKYLVQVQCQPTLAGAEQQIAEALGQNFNVGSCQGNDTGFVVEVVSNHELAYGALKDLADLVESAVSEAGSSLTSGVISRVDRNLLSVLSDTLGPWGQRFDRLFGWTRLVTLMFFHQNVTFDLFLAAKLGQTQKMEPAAGVN
ncbi:MAG: hypothetical protein ACE5Q6_08780 [Dehalococcoidia bacterium]